MNSVCDRPGGLLPLTEARKRLLEGLHPIQRVLKIPAADALGRILADSLLAPIPFPPFANSAMDGYAVRAVDALPGAQLRRVGSIMAGAAPISELGPGECIRIFTGAPIPHGADAVVVQELVTCDGDLIRLDLSEPLRSGANIRRQGEELEMGEVLLPSGTRIGPFELGLLAFAGLIEIPVRDQLCVGVLATGDELIPPGERLAPGQIHESNRPVLLGLIQEMGHKAVDLGTVPDDFDGLRRALLGAHAGLDALITTGGASEGDADFVARALGDLGEVAFWKVAVKPGKPFVFGHLGAVPLFGLPGNPVSAAIIFLKLVKPALEFLSGQGAQCPVTWHLPLKASIRRQPGREEFMRGSLVNDEGGLGVMPLAHQGSHRLTSLSRGDCLIVLPSEVRSLEVGDCVDVELFRPVSWPLEVS
jgi:molybdopterin molybdotransferase